MSIEFFETFFRNFSAIGILRRSQISTFKDIPNESVGANVSLIGLLGNNFEHPFLYIHQRLHIPLDSAAFLYPILNKNNFTLQRDYFFMHFYFRVTH
jgi:hypothetical protein